MDKIVVASRAASKPSYTVVSEAAAAPTVGAGELAVFIGTNIRDNIQIRGLNGVDEVKDALREAQWPVGPLAVNFGYVTPPSKTAIVVDNAAAIPALTEDDVLIAYGATFYDGSNSVIFDRHVDSALEVYREQIAVLN
jgi:hypothetical protein